MVSGNLTRADVAAAAAIAIAGGSYRIVSATPSSGPAAATRTHHVFVSQDIKVVGAG
jgi:hypothetical protein